jgi:hypothetical protein
MPHATLALVNGLLSFDAPRTYEQIFADIDSAEVVLVSGEEDNTYQPGGDVGEPTDEAWTLSQSGMVARGEENRFESPVLPAGRYDFQLSGTSDADLYVRIGTEPDAQLYDCRPFNAGSNESCSVTLSSPAVIHGMVRGYAQSSEYELVGGPAQ